MLKHAHVDTKMRINIQLPPRDFLAAARNATLGVAGWRDRRALNRGEVGRTTRPLWHRTRRVPGRAGALPSSRVKRGAPERHARRGQLARPPGSPGNRPRGLNRGEVGRTTRPLWHRTRRVPGRAGALPSSRVKRGAPERHARRGRLARPPGSPGNRPRGLDRGEVCRTTRPLWHRTRRVPGRAGALPSSRVKRGAPERHAPRGRLARPPGSPGNHPRGLNRGEVAARRARSGIALGGFPAGREPCHPAA